MCTKNILIIEKHGLFETEVSFYNLDNFDDFFPPLEVSVVQDVSSERKKVFLLGLPTSFT